jgi:hypothetical protein
MNFFGRVLLGVCAFGATLSEAKNPAQCALIVETLEKGYEKKRDEFIAAIVDVDPADTHEYSRISAEYVAFCAKMRVQILEMQKVIAGHLAANNPQSLSQLSARLERLSDLVKSDIRGLVTPF